MSKAPATLQLRVCPVCGRNDRFAVLHNVGHRFEGRPCPGVPVVVVYVIIGKERKAA